MLYIIELLIEQAANRIKLIENHVAYVHIKRETHQELDNTE